MNIFLTVGTQLPFDRLARAFDRWCAERGRTAQVFGQIGALGPENYRPANFEWVEQVEPSDFTGRVEKADLLVSHAGMGSIITAMTKSKPILIMPRRADLGEQRNNHQIATCERFAGKPGLLVAEDEAVLSDMIEGALTTPGEVGCLDAYAEDRLISAVRDFIQAV